MRGTLTIIVALSLIALTVVPSTASADFHPVCEPPAAAYANVALHHDGDPYYPSWQYRAGVYCPSTVVTIVELELLYLSGPDAPTQIDNVTADPCESTATQGCFASGSVGAQVAATGTYKVNMTFHVDDPATEGIDFPNVTRAGLYHYAGGAPVPLCVSAGAVPVMVGSCSV